MLRDKSAEPVFERIARVIRAELAFYPGRLSLIARIVLACTSVMVLIMVFRMPGAALGAYYPLLLSRDSPLSTHRSALRTGSICILGTGEIILGAMLFSGSPIMHFFWVAGNLFAVFYLISSLKIYDSALALGLVIANGIATWDQPLSGDMRVRQTLFTLLSILLGCALSVAIEYLFAQTHPPDAVLAAIRQRLTAVRQLLHGYAAKGISDARLRIQLNRYTTKGTGELRELLAHSNYDATYRERLAAALALSGRLVELVANLSESTALSSPEDRRRCAQIADYIGVVNASLVREEAPEWLDPAEEVKAMGSPPGNPMLVEIERNVILIAQSFTDENLPVHHHLPEPGEERRMSIFASDAFTNRAHLKFAARGSLSALACYLLYMSAGWSGLNGSIATCIVTALTNTGATRHKQLMRFAGIILGACVLGFGAQSLILPQIDSLFAFTILFAFVIAAGAWVGTSGPRIAYCGFQIVLAYDLVNLNRFGINTSLVPARDVVLGILLGILAMWLIFDHLWASSSVESMRSMFVSILRDIAGLGHSVEKTATVLQDRQLTAECEVINRNFDRLRSLVDFAVFESFPKTDEELYITRCVRTLQPKLRAMLLVKAGLLHHQLRTEARRDPEIVARVQQRSSEILLATARIIAAYPASDLLPDPVEDVQLTSSIREENERGRSDGRGDVVMEMRLCRSLLDLGRDLRNSTQAL